MPSLAQDSTESAGSHLQLPQPSVTKTLMVGWGQTNPQSSRGQKLRFLVGFLHCLLPSPRTLVTRAQHAHPIIRMSLLLRV